MSSLTNRRAVITGIGAITPLGSGKEKTFESLKAGISGIGKVTRFNAEGYATQIAGEIPDYSPEKYFDKKNERKFDRFTQYAVVATIEALADAKLKKEEIADLGYKASVIISSGIGGLETIELEHSVLKERGPSRVSPFLIPKIIGNMASGNVAILLGAKGPNFSVVSACASSSHAIGIALDLIRMGKAEVVIAGGSEASITPLSIAGFSSMKALSTRNDEPEKASRPFDLKRDGFVIAEGAAVLIIESEEHALNRKARIYCELAGYGFSDDAYHMTAPDPEGEGAALSMKLCLEDADLTSADIDYINAHGTSTPYNDKIETLAIKKVFGKRAFEIPVSSTKSMTGHLLGAAGALEAAICARSIYQSIIYPTINLEYPDPECDLDFVSEGFRETRIKAAISNSFGFGGHNASIAFRAWS